MVALGWDSDGKGDLYGSNVIYLSWANNLIFIQVVTTLEYPMSLKKANACLLQL